MALQLLQRKYHRTKQEYHRVLSDLDHLREVVSETVEKNRLRNHSPEKSETVEEGEVEWKDRYLQLLESSNTHAQRQDLEISVLRREICFLREHMVEQLLQATAAQSAVERQMAKFLLLQEDGDSGLAQASSSSSTAEVMALRNPPSGEGGEKTPQPPQNSGQE